jgi:hypothetical protein
VRIPPPDLLLSAPRGPRFARRDVDTKTPRQEEGRGKTKASSGKKRHIAAAGYLISQTEPSAGFGTIPGSAPLGGGVLPDRP